MPAGWVVPEDEISFRFTPSGGPGGQHANRSNTRVEAVFAIDDSPSMPDPLRRRVRTELGPVVRVTVDDERSQLRNRRLAVERLRARVDEAGRERTPRRPTRRTRASVRRRIEGKRRRGDVKRLRRRPSADD